ncbi:MAG TPA: hypothetical protein VFP20_03145 [Bacteroidales bacterium]|nr:hypothetical protein [Bacteroidales bacterium]
MEHNDYFFYIIVAASVVGSIVKALKKKPEEITPQSKPSFGGDILKKILEEIQDKDDYIPKNPAPAPVVKPIVKQPATSPVVNAAQNLAGRSKNVEMNYSVPEVNDRAQSFNGVSKSPIFEPIQESEDPFLASIDLSSPDEVRKAIIYNEIFRTKF